MDEKSLVDPQKSLALAKAQLNSDHMISQILPENTNIIMQNDSLKIIHGDTRVRIEELPDQSVNCVVTSPPYWGVRDYGVEDPIGAEPNIQDYINSLVSIFSDMRRVLKDDGTFWLNIGNTYTSGGRKWRQEDKKNKGRGMSYRPPTPEGLKKEGLDRCCLDACHGMSA